MNHFMFEYAKRVNEIIHDVLWSTWFYRHEIIEVPDLVSVLLITYDNQQDDEFLVRSNYTWEEFLERMSRVKHDWAYFSRDNMEGLAEQPHKTMLGWEGRTIYFIKGGSHPEYWTIENARTDTVLLLSGSIQMGGVIIQEEIQNIKELIPVGLKHFRDYENFLRIVVNYLFNEHLGEAKLQKRTEPGNEGIEMRDIICQNLAERGFWEDLKTKYSCSEIVIEVKNKNTLTRDDIRQIYCYLKPALGFWGFIICRSEQPSKIHNYNRTLFKNFVQKRGVLILSDDDLQRMVKIKKHGRDPSEYLNKKKSEFIRSI